ncbi:MAG: NAD(+)/NADH kinase [Angelakisella sp.]
MQTLTELAPRYGLTLCHISQSDPQTPLTETQQQLLDGSDVIIAIGGDGTIIHCARLSSLSGKPIMGVNAGKLGFLAQVEASRLEHSLRRLVAGDYQIEYRSAISAFFGDNETPPLEFAINDIVIFKTPEHNMARLEILCNSRMVDCYRADGIILSTATGSTAYNLSAGGPVIDPLLSAVTMVPICPHSLSVRSLVFSENRILTIRSPEPLTVTADGSQRRQIAENTAIQIGTATKRAGFVTFHEQEFFEILTAKIKQRG